MKENKKIIHYILLVDPAQVNMRDLIANIPGFQYPEPIRIVRVRTEAFYQGPALQLFHLTSEKVSNFSNLLELIKELEQHDARKSDLEIKKETKP